MTATRYREIEVSGTPFDMGQQLGEAARDEIRGFDEIALERVNKTVTVSRERAMAVADRCVSFVEEYSADMLAELRGVSDSSGVCLANLMLLQIRNQLQPEADAGCTSFSIAPASQADHHAVVGQNWDNDPALDPFTIILTRRPEGQPTHMNITQAGLVAYIGLNEAGIGVCMNTLPAPSRNVGVPHYFTVRGIYQSESLEDAVHAVRRAHRAIPSNVMLATPEGPADLEVTVDDVHVLGDEGSGIVTHTNHCQHPQLLPINDDFPELIESGPRKCRVDGLLRKAAKPLTLDDLKAVLSDHDNHPTSICRHPNDHPENGYWTSVFSVLIEADAGLMHVSRGNPCEQPYETYSLIQSQ